ncbi:MAG: TIGR04255 family protein [Gemmatimonadaceae bacterium]|nr:TIGR04255 family protein [Gemmatimonadaceae bacterium]NUQ92571.1 TIGR04255 family protein [Gemmatimonadaceae bacterium]NUR34916.1 TIGR04255 family protein [Gemmatimonadaceae bacterium]
MTGLNQASHWGVVSNPTPEVRTLSLPEVTPVEYRRNLVKLAACELRIPTLLEFEEKPPAAFQHALRKEYPHYEQGQALTGVGPGGVEGETRHILRSRHRNYAIVFRASAISLEVSKYEGFNEFFRRLRQVVDAARNVIDSDFFTRIGLRYVNGLPTGPDPRGWVTSDLVRPLEVGVLGTVNRYWQEVRGSAPIGDYSFRHGYRGDKETESAEYLLDIDMFIEDIEVDRCLELVDQLHTQSFAFFHWCLGRKALEYLGTGTPKATIAPQKK